MANQKNNKSSPQVWEKQESKSQGAYIIAKEILVRDSGKFSGVKLMKCWAKLWGDGNPHAVSFEEQIRQADLRSS